MLTSAARERLSPKERFEQFHAANPQVFVHFKRFAWDVKRMGRTRWSADAIIQRIRWFLCVETAGDNFKVNDNFSAYYARLLIAEEPEFDGFFELRKTRQERLLAAAQRDGRLC